MCQRSNEITTHIIHIALSLWTFNNCEISTCGWDNCYIIMIEVRDSLTNEIISGLDILLADSNGRPYTSKWNLENFKETSIYQNTDTLKFGQNNGDNFPKHAAYNIPFGVNSYMLLVYGNNYPEFNRNGKDRIFIHDPDNRYDSVSITFDRNKIAPMCTHNSIWHSTKAVEENTFKVTFKKKKPD